MGKLGPEGRLCPIPPRFWDLSAADPRLGGRLTCLSGQHGGGPKKRQSGGSAPRKRSRLSIKRPSVHSPWWGNQPAPPAPRPALCGRKRAAWPKPPLEKIRGQRKQSGPAAGPFKTSPSKEKEPPLKPGLPPSCLTTTVVTPPWSPPSRRK